MLRGDLRSAVVRAVFVFLATGTVAGATDWYVDGSAPPGGDGSFGSPFQTIQQGINAAMPGDTVFVRAGTYPEGLVSVRGGTAGARITITNYDGETVWVSKQSRVLDVTHPYITVDGLNFDGQFTGYNGMVRFRNGADFGILRNSEIKNAGNHQLRIDADDILIEDCYVHHAISNSGPTTDAHNIMITDAMRVTIRRTETVYATGDNLQCEVESPAGDIVVEDSDFWMAPLDVTTNGVPAGTYITENLFDTKNDGAYGTKYNLTIRGCRLHGSRYTRLTVGRALNLKKDWSGFVIAGNLIYDNKAAFAPRAPSTDYLIYNNLIFDNDQGFRMEDGVGGIYIYNNTIYDVGRIEYDAGGAPGTIVWKNNIFAQGSSSDWHGTYDYNLFWNVPGGWPVGTGNVVADPQFVDPANYDLHLQAGSPAIDAGTTLAQVTVDYDGVSRPQGSAYDMGAYEFHALLGDLDGDGDVDLDDYDLFAAELNGPGSPCDPVADLDDDGDCDMTDFALLAQNFTGPQ